MDVGRWLVIFHDGSLWSINVLRWLIMALGDVGISSPPGWCIGSARWYSWRWLILSHWEHHWELIGGHHKPRNEWHWSCPWNGTGVDLHQIETWFIDCWHQSAGTCVIFGCTLKETIYRLIWAVLEQRPGTWFLCRVDTAQSMNNDERETMLFRFVNNLELSCPEF